MLEDRLKKLNDLIDPEHVAQAEKRQAAAAACESVDRLPLIVNCPVPDWPMFTYRDGFHDMEKMLLNELNQVWVGAHVKDDRMYTIRANYGVGIIASMFGCEILLTDDNIMPWVKHLNDDQLDSILDAGEVDIYSGLGARVLETEAFYHKALSGYDKLASCVRIFVSDTQGPFDNAHLIMGHKIYTEIYDNPERVHRLMEMVTDTYVRFTRAQKEIIGENKNSDYHYHSALKARGAVRVCDDSGINLSAQFYREFSKKYNEQALQRLGGGWIHYCGGGQQILPEVLSSAGVYGINFGNPEKQDIAAVMKLAHPRKAAVLGWPADLPLPDGTTTGVILGASAKNLDSAREMLAR